MTLFWLCTYVKTGELKILFSLFFAMSEARWEKVVTSWMSGKSFELSKDNENEGMWLPPPKKDWSIVDLVKLLFDGGLIPEFICEDADLFNVLML
jgi:hypothetical protein